MKKWITRLLLAVLIVTLAGCNIIFDSEVRDFENCINDECTEIETAEVFVEYLDYVFEESHRDLLFDEDIEITAIIDVSDDEYIITILYSGSGFLPYYTAVTQTLDLFYTVEAIEEELVKLNTEKAYIINVAWVDADNSIKMEVTKEPDTVAQLVAEITDFTMSYDLVLNELLGFLGSYEFVTEHEPVSSYIRITTDVGEFTVYTEYDSFVHEIGYNENESVIDSESKLDKLEEIVLNEKRSGYSVVVK